MIRLNFTSGILTSYEVRKWEAGESGGAFKSIAANPLLAGISCAGNAGLFAFCGASRDPQAAPAIYRDPVFAASGLQVDTPAPDSLLNIAIDVTAALGADAEFSSIQVRTPEDIILGGFQNMGYWRGLSNEGIAKDRQ